MASPSKFDPASINVGNDPVVNPFKRCNVVVGGSAINFNNMALFCEDDAKSYKMGKLL